MRSKTDEPAETYKGSEAAVEIVVELSEGLVESSADLATLEGGGSGKNGDFGRSGESVDALDLELLQGKASAHTVWR